MSERSETERAELVALEEEFESVCGKTMAATIKRLAAPDQKPVQWDDLNCATGRSCEYGPHGPNGEQQCQYCGHSAPPPAAGWNEAIEALDKIDEQMSAMRSLKGWRMTLIREHLKVVREALRHNAPPDSGAGEPCDGCDGHECLDGNQKYQCQYPAAAASDPGGADAEI
jgi:hypothetical protein